MTESVPSSKEDLIIGLDGLLEEDVESDPALDALINVGVGKFLETGRLKLDTTAATTAAAAAASPWLGVVSHDVRHGIPSSPVESRASRLRDMAHALEEIDSARRSLNSPPPSYQELKLQVMIMRHVKMCILLFQYEHSYYVRAAATANPSPKSCPIPLAAKITADCPPAVDVNNQLFEAQNQLYAFQKLFNRLHDIIIDSVLPFLPTDGSTAEDAEDSSGNKKNEEILLNLFHGLEEMRRSRSYAAPTVEEITHYMEIRMWSLSSLLHANARRDWQIFLKCSKPWTFVQDEYIDYHCFSMWAEFRLSMAFDEIPEIVWLFKERVKRFCGIHPNPPKQKSVVTGDAVRCMDVDAVMYGTNDIASDASMLASDDVDDVEITVVAGDAPEAGRRTRMEYLSIIMFALEKIEPLGPKMMLTPREAAVHAVLQEHVDEAIWTYDNEAYDELAGVQENVNNRRIPHDMQTACWHVRTSPALTKNRKELHEEILYSVEAIKTLYVLTCPTLQEEMLYRRIQQKMGQNIEMFCETRCAEKHYQDGGLLVLKFAMNKIYFEEMEFMKVLQQEYIKLLQTTFPFIPKELKITDALTWLHKNKQFAINELVAMSKLPCGLKHFEEFLLVSEEMNSLFHGILLVLAHGNENMYEFLHDASRYRSAAEGISNVFRFSREIPY